jgi:hypothetical protein
MAENDTDELTRLREHNRELLAELKTAKGELKTAQDALGIAQEAQAKAEQGFNAVRLGDPLKAICKQLSPHPGLFEQKLREVADFRLNAEGFPEIFTKDGQPMIYGKDDKRVSFDAEGIKRWLGATQPVGGDTATGLMNAANGGGATGNSGGYIFNPPKPAEAPKQPAPPLGLR